MRSLIKQRGDTLIEVMLSISILSLVVVGAMMIMNRSNSNMLDAVERTAVRAEVNRQTELLNYLRDQAALGTTDAIPTAVTAWSDITNPNRLSANPSDVSVDSCPALNNDNSKRFYITVDENLNNFGVANAGSANIYATAGSGLWIEVVKRGPSGSSYYDFFVRACWDSAAGHTRQLTETVVRLYE